MKGTGASITARAFCGRMGTKIPAHSKGRSSSRNAVVMADISPEAVEEEWVSGGRVGEWRKSG